MENNKFLSGNEQFEAFCSNNVDIAQVLAALPPDRAYNFKHHMWIGWHGHQSVHVPRCPGCGYTEQDCREQMDHHLCGLPEPAPARPVRFAELPLPVPAPDELMRDALDHIARTCHQSRQQSRRIRWIEARANGALEGKPYDAKLLELPVEVDREIDRMKRRDGRHLAHIRLLEGLLREAQAFTNDVAHDPDVWLKIEAALSWDHGSQVCGKCLGSGHAHVDGMPVAGTCDTCQGKGMVPA